MDPYDFTWKSEQSGASDNRWWQEFNREQASGKENPRDRILGIDPQILASTRVKVGHDLG